MSQGVILCVLRRLFSRGHEFYPVLNTVSLQRFELSGVLREMRIIFIATVAIAFREELQRRCVATLHL